MKAPTIQLMKFIGDNEHICIAEFPFRKDFKKAEAVARISMFLYYINIDDKRFLAYSYCKTNVDHIILKDFIDDIALNGWSDFKYWLRKNSFDIEGKLI